MLIRKMTEKDIVQLALLYKQFWGEESSIEKMRKQFDKVTKAGTHVLLSAVEDEKLIGSVMGIICEELYGECRPFMVVENMIVDNNHRNRGIGKFLIAELEKIAAERECTQIILVTETDRVDACRFYESAGYLPDIQKGYKKRL